jgi:hypothetical protein
VREAGELMGVTDMIRESNKKSGAPDRAIPAARVLQHVFEKLLNYKKLEQEDLDNKDDNALHAELGLDTGKRVTFE